MKLSEYFDLSEFESSSTAFIMKIDNTIPKDLLINVVRLHDNILYPLRKATGCPVNISSGYRCEKLNKVISKANNSQHIEAKAADFTVKGQSNLAVVNWIRKNCEFDQLILEKVNSNEWVHVSYNFGKNRKQVLHYDGRQYKSI
jgi:phage FluMu protein Com